MIGDDNGGRCDVEECYEHNAISVYM